MKSQAKYGLLVGAGFLVGSVGPKSLTSQTARRAYVQGVAKGLQAKSYYEGVVEQARVQVGNIFAEARSVNEPTPDASDAARGIERRADRLRGAGRGAALHPVHDEEVAE